jgi:ribosomal protein L29
MKTRREIAARLTELRNELTELMQQNPHPDSGWQRKILQIQASISVLDWVMRGDQAAMMTPVLPDDDAAKS